jgi:nucleotide-binding universal stress UspA family protein
VEPQPVQFGPGTGFAKRKASRLRLQQPPILELEGRNMFGSVLVPLDRSSFAEQALPLALSIARRAKARLDLVEVHTLFALEDAHASWLPFEVDRVTELKQQEQLYLDATAEWVTSLSPVSATADVLSGSAVLPATVADSILERAHAGRADLIVMATHGCGPLSRFGQGSVTDEVIRRAPMPVLLVPATEKAPEIIPEPMLNNILIPLDGSALAEQVLKPVVDLARLMEARCNLHRVVESRPSAAGGPGRQPENAQSGLYLERIARSLGEQGVQAQARVIVARSATEAILGEAQAQASNLIALATHGWDGLKRLLLGSVADKLVRASTLPVLVYCPTAEKP